MCPNKGIPGPFHQLRHNPISINQTIKKLNISLQSLNTKQTIIQNQIATHVRNRNFLSIRGTKMEWKQLRFREPCQFYNKSRPRLTGDTFLVANETIMYKSWHPSTGLQSPPSEDIEKHKTVCRTNKSKIQKDTLSAFPSSK